MKSKINDLLLKLQNGEICVGETANALFELLHWTDNDIDVAYLLGCFNVGGIDGLSNEIKRLKELEVEPHDIVEKIRGKEYLLTSKI